jgi:hypothetical protein
LRWLDALSGAMIERVECEATYVRHDPRVYSANILVVHGDVAGEVTKALRASIEAKAKRDP